MRTVSCANSLVRNLVEGVFKILAKVIFNSSHEGFIFVLFGAGVGHDTTEFYAYAEDQPGWTWEVTGRS